VYVKDLIAVVTKEIQGKGTRGTTNLKWEDCHHLTNFIQSRGERDGLKNLEPLEIKPAIPMMWKHS